MHNLSPTLTALRPTLIASEESLPALSRKKKPAIKIRNGRSEKAPFIPTTQVSIELRLKVLRKLGTISHLADLELGMVKFWMLAKQLASADQIGYLSETAG